MADTLPGPSSAAAEVMSGGTSTPSGVGSNDAPAAKLTGRTPEKVIKKLRSQVEDSRRNGRKYHAEWKRNVELRIGRVASQYTGGVDVENELQTEINPDWSLTKTKIANLYSQTPQVQVQHVHPKFTPAVAPFAKALNYEISDKRADVGTAVEECLNDVVNAAGVGIVRVGWAARFQPKLMPALSDPTKPPVPDAALYDQSATNPVEVQPGQVAAQSTPQVVSETTFCRRISPNDFLWQTAFTGSNFDNADWVGQRGRMSGPEAVHDLKLTPDQLEKALAGTVVRMESDMRSMPDTPGLQNTDVVTYDEIFYWRHKVDPEEKNFKAIWRMVWVEGLGETPVIDEPWKGQQLDPATGHYLGACKFPIRVLTLTYISDNPIPPSDSRAGRPQVNDLRRSRSQMFQNRERSIPIRWFDVNRVDADIQAMLLRGTWQGMIPMNGNGSAAIGEVARASYPAEDLTFDVRTEQDLMKTWRIGPNQMGTQTSGDTTKAEVEMIQGNFATEIGQERARVAKFFLGICEVIAGLMALYSEFPILQEDEKQQMLSTWNNKQMLTELVFKIQPDSTVMIDSQARLQRIYQFLNMTVKSGFVNPMPLLLDAIELAGIGDPSSVIKPPQPPPKPEPQMSYRFTGKEDLADPLVLAFLVKTDQAPGPDDLKAAEAILRARQGVGMERPAGPPAPPMPEDGGDEGQPNPQGQSANPDWNSASKVTERSDTGE